jgi:hypothetical protein
VNKQDIEALRKAAHEAPMNKIHMDHKGRKSLATHDQSWAKASRAYFEALDAMEKDERKP